MSNLYNEYLRCRKIMYIRYLIGELPSTWILCSPRTWETSGSISHAKPHLISTSSTSRVMSDVCKEIYDNYRIIIDQSPWVPTNPHNILQYCRILQDIAGIRNFSPESWFCYTRKHIQDAYMCVCVFSLSLSRCFCLSLPPSSMQI